MNQEVKTCRTCAYYPNNCGYWLTELKPSRPGGSPPSRVSPDTRHNCQDFRPGQAVPAREEGAR
jgi:hypothetical protein